MRPTPRSPTGSTTSQRGRPVCTIRRSTCANPSSPRRKSVRRNSPIFCPCGRPQSESLTLHATRFRFSLAGDRRPQFRVTDLERSCLGMLRFMYAVSLTESHFPAQLVGDVLPTTVGGILRDAAADVPDATAL